MKHQQYDWRISWQTRVKSPQIWVMGVEDGLLATINGVKWGPYKMAENRCFFPGGQKDKLLIPRTQLTSIFEGQPSKIRPFSIKTRVIWVLGRTFIAVDFTPFKNWFSGAHFLAFPAGRWKAKRMLQKRWRRTTSTALRRRPLSRQGSLNYPFCGNQTIQIYGDFEEFPLAMHWLGW